MRAVRQTSVVTALALVVVAGLAGGARAQMAVYPAKGQSAEQQNKDRYECHAWAVQQGGYDPMAAPVAQAPPQRQEGQVLKGAAGAAAVGAIGGAIAGNAGKGAAIGAATGGALGLLKKGRDRRAEDDAVAQQQAQAQQQRATYDKFFAACMTGRGYSVTR